MTKSEFIWVIVRLVGFVFIMLALWSFLSFIGSLMLLSSFTQTPTGSSSIILYAIIQIAVLFIVGGYLIMDGSLLFGILDREND